MYGKSKGRWIKHLDFIILDAASVLFSLVMSFLLRFGTGEPYKIEMYKIIFVLVPAMVICVAFFTETHRGILRRGYIKEFKSVSKLVITSYVLVVCVLYLMHISGYYSRKFFGMSFGISYALVYILRISRKHYLKYIKNKENNKNLSHVMIVTNKAALMDTLERVNRNDYVSFNIVAICITDDKKFIPDLSGVLKGKDISILHSGKEIIEYARTNILDEVFFNTVGKEDRVYEIGNMLVEMGVVIHINLDKVSNKYPNKVVENFNGYTVMTSSVNTATIRQIVLKRIIDIIGSLVGIVFTVIIFIIFAPIIYIQSPGPIFFKQKRVGKNGRTFKMYKFRSMYLDAEERKKELMAKNKMNGLMFKMDNDPRIIPIGKFMRKTSLDEFPQFFNVLKGDMSLVGTRPPTMDEYERYEYRHKKRLAAKPGITGMWQVSGRSNITDFEEVVRLDSEYITNWTLGLDLKILCKTVSAVFEKDGSM